MEQPGCEQDQPPSRVLCSFGVGCTLLAAELQQRIGAGGSRGGSRRRRCVFLAECNALSKWFWYFAVAPVLTHRCSSVTPAPSPVFAKKRRIPSRPGLLGEGPCREQSAPSPAPRGASSRAVSRGQALGHAAGRLRVLLTQGLLFSCLQLSQKFGSRARNSGWEEAVWAVPSGPVFPRDASSPCSFLCSCWCHRRNARPGGSRAAAGGCVVWRDQGAGAADWRLEPG